MKGFDILKVKSAVKSHNKFDLSRTHLTTMDFGEIVPLFVEETVPGDKFDIQGEYFSRMAPLVKPTYGKFSFKTVAAFVPYHQIAWDSDAWFAGKTTWEGQTPHQRYITIGELNNFFGTCLVTYGGANSGNSEYTWIDSNGVENYRRFTNTGKYFAKVMNALGYACPQGVDMRSASTWYTSVRDTKLSAYPLLAFFKLYNDYMSQSQRYNSSTLSNILQCIKYGKTISGFNPSTGAISYTLIQSMFNNLFLNYENDYFTSAWQQPNNAINGYESLTGLEVPGYSYLGADYPQTETNMTDNMTIAQTTTDTQGATIVKIGQRALDFLKDFDDWVRRNNYSGSRAVQQIYSRFGIKTDDYKSHYANVLSTDTVPVQVGDITATAQQFISNGNDKNLGLGDYAGKGIMTGSKGISCNVSDYGILLILGYFTVAPMNAYGFDKRVLRNTPLDYYNPEFDGIGGEAISLGEVWTSPVASSADTTLDTGVFGFTERYNAYRYGRDMITGEFRDYRNDGDMNVWHTGRNLAAIRAAGNLVAQSTAMNTLPQSDSEYNRIFSITDGSVNHFYMTARFNVSAVRPMLNLNQVPRLGEGDTVVPRNGNVIS